VIGTELVPVEDVPRTVDGCAERDRPLPEYLSGRSGRQVRQRRDDEGSENPFHSASRIEFRLVVYSASVAGPLP
jgi:hypothetical protein